MEQEIKLKDIANDLFILNKHTIDKLFSSEDPSECVALYCFYYKTAKWQQTNQIKAADLYVKKCLKWGKTKITKIKNELKQLGLIEIVQKRTEGKINGWFIKINYIVEEKKLDILIDNVDNIEDLKNPQNQQVVKSTSGKRDTNALIYNNKCLKIKDNILVNNKDTNDITLQNNNSLSLPGKEKKFIEPSIEDIENYVQEKNLCIDPLSFFNYYSALGWHDTNNKKIKNWKLKAVMWDTKQKEKNLAIKKQQEQDSIREIKLIMGDLYDDKYIK